MAGDSFQLNKLERLVARDQKLIFTLTSYGLILAIYINSNAFGSWALGIAASTMYFVINGIFLGNAVLTKEDAFFRLMFGLLLLIMLLGFVGWLAVIVYNLDNTILTLVLFVASTLSSLINRRVRAKNAT